MISLISVIHSHVTHPKLTRDSCKAVSNASKITAMKSLVYYTVT